MFIRLSAKPHGDIMGESLVELMCAENEAIKVNYVVICRE